MDTRWLLLAKLAGINPDRVDAAMQADVERVLSYVERLAAFDDPTLLPLYHPNLPDDAIDWDALRHDQAAAPRAMNHAQVAPAWRDGRFEVPRTVDS